MLNGPIGRYSMNPSGDCAVAPPIGALLRSASVQGKLHGRSGIDTKDTVQNISWSEAYIDI